MRLSIATWNINSLRLRRNLLPRLVAELDPDLLCLQETKVPDELFPDELPASLGFPHHLRRGMKSYNGVAIFSRLPIEIADSNPDWCERQDSRHIAVRLATPSGKLMLHNFYVPAGGDVADPETNEKFAHKLAFLAETAAFFAAHKGLERTVLAGDLNVAPLPSDVWSHRQLLNVVSHTKEETEALKAWLKSGFVDAVRHFVGEEARLYTWWSYRNRAWRASDRGRRLDHVWVTPDLVAKLAGFRVLKDARDWPSTSDHVPVMVTLAL